VTTTDIANRNAIQAAQIATNNNIVANDFAYQQAVNAYNALTAAQKAVTPFPLETPDTITVPTLGVPTITHGLNVNLPVAGAPGSIALSILRGSHALDLELTAMESEGKGDVISNPRVITSNQKEAIISQGDEIGYVTITGGAAGAAATPSVQFKDVLLKLRVTPTITNDNRVFMALDINKDELAKFITVANFGDVPQITKREITTAVLVDSGQTVVIGGVYEFKSREDLTKVPFLGDLPGLGNLFRTKAKSSAKAELLVFVTPKILEVRQRDQVSYPASAPAPARNEAPEFRN
jgi:type IV pilus assembly protein PilQ